jgi:hypothetical protein
MDITGSIPKWKMILLDGGELLKKPAPRQVV